MFSLLDIAQAEDVFRQMPESLQLPTLSPAYSACDAQREKDAAPVYLCYREGDAVWLHCLHLTPVPDTAYSDLRSPYGYGGPLANTEDEGFISRANEAAVEWCRRNAILVEFVRFHPVAENIRFYTGATRFNRPTVMIDVRQPDYADHFATRTRRGIKKAQSMGVTFEWRPAQEIASRFPDHYYRAMEQLGAEDRYFFPLDYFVALSQLPEARLAACVSDGNPLTLGVFLWGKRVIEYHLGATSPEGKEKRSSFLMFAEVARAGAAEGRTGLYLGGGTDSRPDNSLLFFKSGFAEPTLSFHIGWRIYDPAAYERLRISMQERGLPISDRIPFYR